MDSEPLFERSESSLEVVRLDEIQPWRTSGAKNATRKAIEALGERGTIILKRLPSGSQYRYKVVDGKRRLSNLQALGHATVKADVMPEEADELEVLAVRGVMNLARGPNPLEEAEVFEELFHAYRAVGVPEEEVPSSIARKFGLPVAVVKQRLGLLALPPVLREGVREGKIAPGVAAKIANLPPKQQEQLAEELNEKGKLTEHDVKEVRRAKQEAVLAELPENLFAPLDDPRERARAVLKGFLDEGLLADELVAIVRSLQQEGAVF